MDFPDIITLQSFFWTTFHISSEFVIFSLLNLTIFLKNYSFHRLLLAFQTW